MKIEDKSTNTACAQCGDKTPEDGFTTKDVIHQKMNWGTGKKYVGKPRFPGCTGQPCGAPIQMASGG